MYSVITKTSSQCLCTVVICVLLGCGAGDSPKGDDVPLYELKFGRRLVDVHFQDFTVPTPEDGHEGEEVVFLLNGHPLVYRWNREISNPVNQFLRSGVNEVSLSASPQAAAYLQVLEEKKNDFAVLLQEHLAAKDKSGDTSWTFKCPVDYRFRLDELSVDSENQRKKLQGEIFNLVEQLHEAIRKQRAEVVADKLLEGYQKWSHLAYGFSAQNVKQYRKRIADYIKANGARCKAIDRDNLHIKFGKSSIFVYAGWFSASDDVNVSPYLFTFTDKDGKVLRRWPLRFVRINGEWIIWHLN